MINELQTPSRNTLFPVFFKIEKQQTLIVGGGKVGLEKLSALLANAPMAPITLVGKTILPEIKQMAMHYPYVCLQETAFSTTHFQHKNIVIIATNDSAVNEEIYHKAKACHLLVNVADTPELCDFYLGSIVQKGNLKIAISTNGQSPTLAKRMRELLTSALPDEIETVLKDLKQIRDALKGNFSYKVKRLNEITAVMAEKIPHTKLNR